MSRSALFPKDSGILHAHKPKIGSNAKGATWDYLYIRLPNGQKVKGYADMSWGAYAYFEYNGKWYKTSVARINRQGDIDFDKTVIGE